MYNNDAEEMRSFTIELCIQAHLHAILIGRIYGTPFLDHVAVTRCTSYLATEKNPQAILAFPDSAAVNEMLDLIQRFEDGVMEDAQRSIPEEDMREVLHSCENYDIDLVAYMCRAQAVRIHSGAQDPLEKIHDELARRGNAGRIVSSATRSTIRDRVCARLVRRKSLRIPAWHASM